MIHLNSNTFASPVETKRQIVRDFTELLEQSQDKDEPALIHRLVRYLQGLLRIRKVVPPVVEIMTILKHERPILYHSARRSVTQTSNLHMLFQVEMDLRLARKRLDEYLS